MFTLELCITPCTSACMCVSVCVCVCVWNVLAARDFWLFLKLKENLRRCRYETIEELKEAVTKVIDTLTQEDFHGAFQK